MTAPDQTARCRWCARRLRTPASIAAGYGPVCAVALGLPPPRPARTRTPTTAPVAPRDEPTGQLALITLEDQ